MYSAFSARRAPHTRRLSHEALRHLRLADRWCLFSFDLVRKLWKLLAARQSRIGQGRQSAGSRGSLPVGQVAVKQDAMDVAWAACLSVYDFDIKDLQPHERASVRNAVQAAMNEGTTFDIWEAAAANQLRELMPKLRHVVKKK